MLSDREILELAERAKRGEREAQGKLVSALRPLVCRWALVMTGDPDDAEDIAQRVMLKMLESIGGFDGRSKLTSWLYRITWNACLDHQRSERRYGELRDKAEGLARSATPHLEDPLDGIELERTLRLVRKLFTKLPRKQRQAFDLVDLQGFKPAEAARMLEMNASTLRVHLLRARRRMRREMLAAGYRPEE